MRVYKYDGGVVLSDENGGTKRVNSENGLIKLTDDEVLHIPSSPRLRILNKNGWKYQFDDNGVGYYTAPNDDDDLYFLMTSGIKRPVKKWIKLDKEKFEERFGL